MLAVGRSGDGKKAHGAACGATPHSPSVRKHIVFGAICQSPAEKYFCRILFAAAAVRKIEGAIPGNITRPGETNRLSV